MSNYQRKRDRSGELSQSGLKPVKAILRLGNFQILYQKKDARQVHLFSFNPVKIGCTLQKKKRYLLFKVFLFDCVFVSNTGDTVKGVFLGIPQRRPHPGSSLQQPQPRFQTKTTS